MFTHISRGMESIPAVFVVGSTVKRINVSVQNGQSPLTGSPPRRPTNRILIRLLPSQVGYWISSEARNSGVGFGSGVLGSPLMAGVSSGLAASPAQLAGEIPGKEVSRQQTVKDCTKLKSPTALTSARLQKAIWRTGNCWRFSLGTQYSLENLEFYSSRFRLNLTTI